MKILIFFIFFTLLSCSKKDEAKYDLETFINQGKKVELYKDSTKTIKKNFVLDKVNIQNQNLNLQWHQANMNSSNLLGIGNKDLNKIKKKYSLDMPKCVFSKKTFFCIGKRSKIILLDESLKLIAAKQIYKRKIYNNYKLNFSIAFYNNKIAISDNLGNIRVLNSKNLKDIWIKTLNVPFRSEIKIYKDNIFVINSNSKIYSIDINSGEINWSIETASRTLKQGNSYQISAYEDKILFINDYAEIYCIDLKLNKMIWSNSIQELGLNYIPAVFKSSPLVIDKNKVYFSSNNSSFFALNLSDGSILWKKQIQTTNIPIVLDNKILIVNKNGFYILNKMTGEVLNFYNNNLFLEIAKSKKTKIFLKKIYVTNKKIYLFSRYGEIFYINNSNLKKLYFLNKFSSFEDYIFFENFFILITKKELIKF